MLHDEHAQGDGDGDGDRHGDEDKGEVVESGAKDFGAVREEKIPRSHCAAPSDGSRQAQKAWTSRWLTRRKSLGGARATTRPAQRRAMRWPRRRASRTSWVTKTMVLWRRRA